MWCVFCGQKIVLKKILKIVSITLIIIILMCILLNHPMHNYFLPNLAPMILPHLSIFICVHPFYLSEPLLIYDCLWQSLLIHDYLWESLLIFDHLWESLLFCENLFWILLICENLLLFMVICENILAQILLFTIFLNKQGYEYHHLKHILYYQNTIIIFRWFRMLQFYVFYFEFFSICVRIFYFLLNKVSLNLLNSVAMFTPFAILDSLPSIFFTECIIEFNPTN